MRASTTLPIVLKGILRGDDAARASTTAARRIVVSNHGGRQLDGVPATIDALPGVVDAVAGRCEVLARRRRSALGRRRAQGAGVGAGAVLLGRPSPVGPRGPGAAGVQAVLRDRAQRAVTCMALAAVEMFVRSTATSCVREIRCYASGRCAAACAGNPLPGDRRRRDRRRRILRGLRLVADDGDAGRADGPGTTTPPSRRPDRLLQAAPVRR